MFSSATALPWHGLNVVVQYMRKKCPKMPLVQMLVSLFMFRRKEALEKLTPTQLTRTRTWYRVGLVDLFLSIDYKGYCAMLPNC